MVSAFGGHVDIGCGPRPQLVRRRAEGPPAGRGSRGWPARRHRLARFAYGLLLPAMRADLGWTYAQAGAMNTSNAAGYLFGQLAAVRLARRFGSHRTLLGALLVTALSVLGCAATGHLAALLVLRLLAGAAGAVAFVAATGAGRRGRCATLLDRRRGAGRGVRVRRRDRHRRVRSDRPPAALPPRRGRRLAVGLARPRCRRAARRPARPRGKQASRATGESRRLRVDRGRPGRSRRRPSATPSSVRATSPT